jgi:hypothetical protein
MAQGNSFRGVEGKGDRMAGKYALYLPFHIIDALEGEGFSDSEIGAFIRGIIKYHLEGTPPIFEDRALNLLFRDNKPEFDHNIEKYKAVVQARRKAGKKGGAPKGNANAIGNRGGGAPKGNQNASNKMPKNKHKQNEKMVEFDSKKQTQAKQPDIDLDLDIDKRSSSEVVFSKQPPPKTTTTFINACKETGYHLDRKKAAEILNAGIDFSWFIEPFTYLDYIAGEVQKNYPDKPSHEKQKLFIALLAKEDKKDAFPAWRKSKDTEAATQEVFRQKEEEKQGRIELARSNKPDKCKCGHPIAFNGGEGECPACNIRYFFDDEKEGWEYADPAEFESLAKRFLEEHLETTTEGIEF